VGEVAESSLVMRPIGHIEYGVFATPAYLMRQAAPRQTADKPCAR
jgi:hypothetical protein